MLTLILDADVEAYTIAHACTTVVDWGDGETQSQAENWEERLHERISGYLDRFDADSIFVALSCQKSNWRKRALDSYKENRDTSHRPELWAQVQQLLIDEYHAVSLPSLEGDDILGLAATTDHWFSGSRIMVSIDKDMRTIPGWLWDPLHPEMRPQQITARKAAWCLAYQSLVGDRVDNYFGVPGIGPSAAVELLDGCLASPNYKKLLWEAVVTAYEEEGLDTEDALVQLACARILQAGDYDFDTGEVKVWQ